MKHPSIDVEPIPGGALVRLPMVWRTYRAFRKAFPRAKPDEEAWCWVVRKKNAAVDLELFAAEREAEVIAAQRRAAWAKQDAEWETRP